MKTLTKVLIATAFGLVLTDARADWLYGPDEDGDAAILTHAPCTLQIPGAEFFRAAKLKTKDGVFVGCWTAGADVILTRWEPAAQDAGWKMPAAKFRKEGES